MSIESIILFLNSEFLPLLLLITNSSDCTSRKFCASATMYGQAVDVLTDVRTRRGCKDKQRMYAQMYGQAEEQRMYGQTEDVRTSRGCTDKQGMYGQAGDVRTDVRASSGSQQSGYLALKFPTPSSPELATMVTP